MKIMISSLIETADNVDFIKRNNINLISIRDTTPSKTYQLLYDKIDNAGLDNLFAITFDDLVEDIEGFEERAPTEQNIGDILNWAKQKMKENNNGFVVQCTGGVSRSSAVAILIKYLENPEKALSVINPIYHSPNEKVLELGQKLLNNKDLKDNAKQIMEQYSEEFNEKIGT